MTVFSLVGLLLLSACDVVPPAAPPAPPPPQPAALPASAPARPLAVASEKPWDVAPLGRGDWQYRKDGTGTEALFGSPANPDLTLRCDPASRRITIVASIGAGSAMTVRTSAGDYSWPAHGMTYERVRRVPDTSVTLPASDPALDAIAYSRGRISVEGPGLTRLIVPVWAEISRVIEDCRN